MSATPFTDYIDQAIKKLPDRRPALPSPQLIQPALPYRTALEIASSTPEQPDWGITGSFRRGAEPAANHSARSTQLARPRTLGPLLATCPVMRSIAHYRAVPMPNRTYSTVQRLAGAALGKLLGPDAAATQLKVDKRTVQRWLKAAPEDGWAPARDLAQARLHGAAGHRQGGSVAARGPSPASPTGMSALASCCASARSAAPGRPRPTSRRRRTRGSWPSRPCATTSSTWWPTSSTRSLNGASTLPKRRSRR